MSDMDAVERLMAEARSLEYEERLSLIEALRESLRRPQAAMASPVDDMLSTMSLAYGKTATSI